MLISLSIQDIVLIDRLDLHFSAGLSVLTGETGAGKSILLDALSLALGGRGDGSLVRHGAAQGQVIAVFDLSSDHKARNVAQEFVGAIDGDFILRRVQFADGKSRAFLNDTPISVQALKLIGAALVEIHGQHADRALIDPSAHRALIDDFSGLSDLLRGVQLSHSEWRSAKSAYQEAETRINEARKEADYLRHASAELAKLSPELGEEEKLAERRQVLMRAEKSIADLQDAEDLLSGDRKPGAVILSALRRIDRRKEDASATIVGVLTALETALTALDEAQSGLVVALRETEFDPRELERIEERLFALRAAARKYQVPVGELAALAERYAQNIEALDFGEGQLRRLFVKVAECEKYLRQKAQALSEKRREGAADLDKNVANELPPLKLERAQFITQIESNFEKIEASGVDRVEFHVATNPGSKPGPMMKIASGGELARFMLALKVILAEKTSAPTLVFDEIDTGVGGAVADAIGARLARLAQNVQVLAVTHAPQVAARASTHFHIAKNLDLDSHRVVTRVHQLDHSQRCEEIARMLSGAEITDEARAAAAKLLES